MLLALTHIDVILIMAVIYREFIYNLLPALAAEYSIRFHSKMCSNDAAINFSLWSWGSASCRGECHSGEASQQ